MAQNDPGLFQNPASSVAATNITIPLVVEYSKTWTVTEDSDILDLRLTPILDLLVFTTDATNILQLYFNPTGGVLNYPFQSDIPLNDTSQILTILTGFRFPGAFFKMRAALAGGTVIAYLLARSG